MNRIVKSLAALAAAVGLVFLGSAWSAQDGGKKAAPQQASASTKEAEAKARAEHMAAFKKAFPMLKLPLSQAITLAETDSKGKAHSADVELGKDGKLHLEIGLLVGEEFKVAYIDQDTKKVTYPKEHEDGDDDDDDDDGK